ncbi:hypothetical protein BRCON_2404 [Candidatus Sumerlaea chitinivorans]|uniref:Uncharacterized protein n=1 Tax=Sumerlaea chitinivorans TaxID=2250252 RepID=A0A2Z4Y7G2_SUMC1|nr:hypothetical protein BRCON_2404 [Candidatus Sumerlaea chitinivorans]
MCALTRIHIPGGLLCSKFHNFRRTHFWEISFFVPSACAKEKL